MKIDAKVRGLKGISSYFFKKDSVNFDLGPWLYELCKCDFVFNSSTSVLWTTSVTMAFLKVKNYKHDFVGETNTIFMVRIPKYKVDTWIFIGEGQELVEVVRTEREWEKHPKS